MLIGGLQRSSLVDYPHKISAVIFTTGCNFECPYCHNPELVIAEQYTEPILEEDLYSFLKKRAGKLDAVCITGGEPTLHNDLAEFIKEIKNMGFLIKLDTNGTGYEMLKKCIDAGLLDYVAMDIKAPLEDYNKIVRREVDIDFVRKSIDLILGSGIDHEFRTTVVKGLTAKDDIQKIGQIIAGAQNYYLQKFVPTKTIDESFKQLTAYTTAEMESWLEEIKGLVDNSGVR